MTARPDASRVLVALRVPATPERAFATFTERIDDWWVHNGLFQFTRGRTGTMVFETGPSGRLLERYDDGTEFVIGAVRAWDPPYGFVIGWRQAGFTPDQDTELHVSFAAVQAHPPSTRVTVEHFGWDRIPPESAARHGFPLPVFSLRFAQWWRDQLAGLAGRAR
ncbi:SRPBCC domain-containing protein [Tsukamurella tyrosinosolvens]|uniref:SRPBCC domain-containing protein n=1 Tax=Tsukamurella tyrosinosolvens TaxID=57704 RepID=UPI000798E376|nr:SRPBCC domain-containing protein [Tsukamurella tyrosinosolvens]KXP02410.1 ATPase [Tsukamurella tyrosinosolvens]KZL96548.1 ATPase [Tsukamurella tyrosinosolvens]MCA4996438.1 SRPBCC domain-containing protein [Tsukamurella tyrosinosolvens]MEC4614967.1 SRPBCC domain-containing protein [Tsukamurella tyrosinosolvens]